MPSSKRYPIMVAINQTKGNYIMDYHVTTMWAVIIAVLAIWELAWKGVALWRASRANQLTWYIAILVINTVGILPILYILISRNQAVQTDKPSVGKN